MVTISTQKLRRAEFLTVLTVLLFGAAVAILSFFAGGEKVIQNISQLSLVLVVGMLAMSLINYFARAYRWHVFSKHLDIYVPIGRSLIYYFSGFSMTTTPGKVGEALRLWLLKRCHQYNYSRVTPLFLGDRLSDMNAMLVLCVFGLATFTGYLWSTLLAAVVFIVVTLLFFRPSLLILLVNTIYHALGHRRPKLFARMRRVLRFTARLFDPKIFCITMLLAVGGWAAECTALYWLLTELGVQITWFQAAFIFAFAMIAGAVSMLPGGLGGVEIVMMSLLIALDVNLDVAITATAVIRLTTLWFAVMLGFFTLPVALGYARRCDPSPAGSS